MTGSGWALDESSGGGKRSDSSRGLTMEPTGWVGRSDGGYERKRGVEDDSRFWGPRTWKDGVAIY